MKQVLGYTIIKEMRMKKKLSQRELAKKVGLTQQAIALLESGKRKMEFDLFVGLLNAMNANADEISDAMNLVLKGAQKTSPFWTSYLDDKLKQVDCSIGFYEEDAYLWINFPDGTLEVSEDDLKELNDSTDSFLLFKLEELKKKYPKRFRPKK